MDAGDGLEPISFSRQLVMNTDSGSVNGNGGVVSVRGLEVRHGGVVAVRSVDLDARERQLTALLGPSGCGKTSLLRAIVGLEVPTAGTVCIRGEVVSGPGRWVPPEERRVGMVFQEGALFPHLTVWRNVVYGLAGRPDADRRAAEALELVGMQPYRERYPDELSGGQQQRVALARALAPSPEIVLLDEPFVSLEAALRARVRDEVRGILKAAGATAVLVTHDQEEALSIADTVAVMMEGQVLQVGTPEDLYRLPASVEVAGFVGDGQLIDCMVDDGEVRSALGATVTDAADGPGLLLVRPEDVEALPLDGGGEARERPGRAAKESPSLPTGTVTDRHFYGHDVLDEVELDSGKTILVRLLGPTTYPVGCQVLLRLRPKQVPVFPRQQ